jgi:hypothetical protein
MIFFISIPLALVLVLLEVWRYGERKPKRVQPQPHTFQQLQQRLAVTLQAAAAVAQANT